MEGKNTIKRMVTAALLAVFCWYMGSVTLFPHVHVVDGVVICHSHPYSGSSDNPGHTHSLAQFETIAHLSLVLLVLAALFSGSSLLKAKKHGSVLQPTLRLIDREITVPYLRGPPCR